MVVRMVRIVTAQTTRSRTVMVAGSNTVPTITREPLDLPVPDELPFKYIVLGSAVNPGSLYRYETDTLLTDADIERMIRDESLKVIFDKGPWTW
jgi:hypothetical protein